MALTQGLQCRLPRQKGAACSLDENSTSVGCGRRSWSSRAVMPLPSIICGSGRLLVVLGFSALCEHFGPAIPQFLDQAHDFVDGLRLLFQVGLIEATLIVVV